MQPPSEFIFYLVAYGIPAMLQVVLLSMRLYRVYPAPQSCWVEYGTFQIAFASGPELVAVAINSICLFAMVYKMRLSAKRWGIKSQHKGLFLVQICFLLTTVGAILECVPNGGKTIYTVAVCFGALQGFFNSLAMKQKALLQFLVKVKAKIHYPTPPSPTVTALYSPTSSTWLLQQAHPAMHDSYNEYYKRQSATFMSASRPAGSSESASFSSFSSVGSATTSDSSFTAETIPQRPAVARTNSLSAIP